MIKFQKMSIYKLLRNPKLNHEMGRPVIFLNYFGQESLIWAGTTQMNSKWKDKSLMININDKLPRTLAENLLLKKYFLVKSKIVCKLKKNNKK
ncbi:hypothetical protein [Spiroplasma sp. AdecLV25b]|uniref:hypothetical protein n=1 Tax=Spiroplasma sp. AdecLV25b TaxID=3027162 RepID=UPI0027E084FD|nr:hypothetical protein [Spiroplasma sp. AdecLV25b]